MLLNETILHLSTFSSFKRLLNQIIIATTTIMTKITKLHLPNIGSYSSANEVPIAKAMKVPIDIPPIVFALIVGGSLLFSFKRTAFGLRLKAVGSNPESSQRFGIEPGRYILYAFALAGAIGGIAGVVQATVVYHKLVPFISGGYGFLGILIALISSRNLALVVLVSIVFACLLIGGTQLQLKLGMHSSLSGIIQGLLVLTWILIKASKLDDKLTGKILEWSKVGQY